MMPAEGSCRIVVALTADPKMPHLDPTIRPIG